MKKHFKVGTRIATGTENRMKHSKKTSEIKGKNEHATDATATRPDFLIH